MLQKCFIRNYIQQTQLDRILIMEAACVEMHGHQWILGGHRFNFYIFGSEWQLKLIAFKVDRGLSFDICLLHRLSCIIYYSSNKFAVNKKLACLQLFGSLLRIVNEWFEWRSLITYATCSFYDNWGSMNKFPTFKTM